jgi:hypothetical protein
MAVDLGAARESERRVAVRAIKQKHRARQRPARPQSEKSVPVRAGLGALHLLALRKHRGRRAHCEQYSTCQGGTGDLGWQGELC